MGPLTKDQRFLSSLPIVQEGPKSPTQAYAADSGITGIMWI